MYLKKITTVKPKTKILTNKVMIKLIKKKNINKLYKYIEKKYGKNTKRFSQESLLNLSLFFKQIPGLENYRLMYCIRSGNNGFEITELDSKKFLSEKVNNGSQSGKVDHVIVNEENEFGLISSKCPDTEECQQFKYYETESFTNTALLLKEYGYKETERYTGIITNCKKKELLKFIKRNGDNNSIAEKKLNEKFLFGKDEINKMYKKLREFLLDLGDENIINKLNIINKITKKRLNLRFYQKYISEILRGKMMKLNGNVYLLGCSPRIGKSYIIADIILKEKYKNVLITSRIKTNLYEGNKELYEDYGDFEENDYNISMYKESFNDGTIDFDKKNIIVSTNEKCKNEIDFLLNKFDAVFFDECHIGSGAENVDEEIMQYLKPDGKLVLVSATFKKPKTKFKIKDENCVFFTDIEICKLKNKNKKFIKKMEKEIGEIDKDEINNFHYPRLNIFNIAMKNLENKELIKKYCKDGEFSINFGILFSTNENSEFINKTDVYNLLKDIFVENSNYATKKSLITDIERTKIINRNIKSVITYLPSIESIVAVEKILKEHFSKKYSVISFYSDKGLLKSNKKNPRKQIEKMLKNNPNKTLIILVCSMLETAITIKSCDGVILLDDKSGEDSNMQRIRRSCSNESENVFVLDGNPNRIINTIVKYSPFNLNVEQTEIKKYFMKLIGSFYNFFDDNYELRNNSIIENISNTYYEQHYNLNKFENCCSSIKKSSINDINIDIKGIKKLTNKELKLLQHFEKTKSKIRIKNDEYNKEEQQEKQDSKKEQQDMLKLLLFRQALIFCYTRITLLTKEGECLKEKIDNITNYELDLIFDKVYNLHSMKLTKDIILKIYKELARDDQIIILCNYIIMEIKNKSLLNIYEVVENFLKPNELQKKKNGEVFTPLELIREKCEKIPKDFWSNPNVKVLDPCCGIGNYEVVLIEYFMNGLKDKIPDEKKRMNHITNEILYCYDICPINISLCKMITNIRNVYCKDFLTTEFNIKFDLVIGNPPYNDNQNALNKRGGGDSLWNKFIIKGLSIVKKDGLLVYVHPSGWRKPESEKSKFNGLFKILTNTNTMIYLEIHNSKDGLKTFQAGTRYDWYIVKKCKNNSNTLIKDENGIEKFINLNNLKFLPNCNIDLVLPLLGNDNDFCKMIYNVSNYESRKKYVKTEKTKEFKYPLIHSTNKSGIRYMYSSVNDKGHFGVSKVIFGESGINDVIIDMNGEYGMTQGAIAIIISSEKEGEELKKYLLNDKFKKILDSCSWGNFRIDWRLFTYFKKDFWKI